MRNTKIEWAEKVWNPVTGCSQVSLGCANCYAERQAKRFWGTRSFHDVLIHADRFQAPIRWKNPAIVFVNSVSDLFHPTVKTSTLIELFEIMHTFLILTKRAKRMEHEVNTNIAPHFGDSWPLENVWLGVSVEDQIRADERIPSLLKTNVAHRFLSCEPLLGSVNLTQYLEECFCSNCTETLNDEIPGNCNCGEHTPSLVEWVIVGGESGIRARPLHPRWVYSLRDQCLKASIPFYFKQWGEFISRYECKTMNLEKEIPGWELRPEYQHLADELRSLKHWGALGNDGTYYEYSTTFNSSEYDPDNDYEVTVYRVGKRNAGNLLGSNKCVCSPSSMQKPSSVGK
jgi:protein gp37